MLTEAVDLLPCVAFIINNTRESKKMDESAKVPIRVKNDPRPLYTQTIEAVTNLILEGGFKSGDQLPKENVLANQLGVSRSTLRVALGYLETYGMISRRPGVGTFVASPVSRRSEEGYLSSLDRLETLNIIAERAGVDRKFKYRNVESVVAKSDIAWNLGVDEGTALVRVEVVETIENKTAALFNTLILGHLVNLDSLKKFNDDVIAYLAMDVEQAPTHTRSEISAVRANREVAEKLDVSVDDPLLYLDETFFTKDGKCVAVSKNHFVSGVFHFYLIRRVIVRS